MNNNEDKPSGHSSKSNDQIEFEEEEKEILELRQTLNTNFDIEPSHEKSTQMQSSIMKTGGKTIDDSLLEETIKPKEKTIKS